QCKQKSPCHPERSQWVPAEMLRCAQHDRSSNVIFAVLDKVRGYFTVLAYAALAGALGLKPET
ncbi:MAG: hypothetical protein WCG26_12255, partial [Chloroflexales bacterium]